jgi:hypothetical protein
MIASLIGAIAFMADPQATQTARAPRWALRADPGLCELETRDGEPPVVLSIETAPGSDSYRVAIATRAPGKTVSYAPASLTFAPSQKMLTGRANGTKLPDGTRLIWVGDVAPALLDNLSAAGSVALAIKSGERVSVPVPGSAKAVEALRRCNADQLIEWGADVAQFAPGGTTPVAVKNREEWLSKSTLLAAMGKARRPDVDETFRVAVSPDGVVDDCHALAEKIEKGVEKTVCDAVIGKPFFIAAKAPDGNPVRGAASFRIRLASRSY